MLPLRITRFKFCSLLARLNPLHRFMATAKSTDVGFLGQQDSIAIDQELVNTYKFTVEQLMEVAGLNVADIVADIYPKQHESDKVLICVGPGHNGGDGLIAARHLLSFGVNPVIFCPKRAKSIVLERLIEQVEAVSIPILDTLPSTDTISKEYSLVLDCLFGFSYKPPIRKPFDDVLRSLVNVKVPLISLDIPSGWDVEQGPGDVAEDMRLQPETLISLTAPKLGSKHFKGKHHFLGLRMVPPQLLKKFGVNFPLIPGTKQYIEI
ncbi:NAD(P)H-hydrate epimerase [Oopsacas minuta]|uniref:NAD(P)H-hydrate epimerase n=1 Tax=Oopsacas minuta TaxID=111878 RepID=A0AAV7K0P6_9METZ|nr:NAD(P)H-hydrate epimerase [Oopsacas minuta]